MGMQNPSVGTSEDRDACDSVHLHTQPGAWSPCSTCPPAFGLNLCLFSISAATIWLAGCWPPNRCPHCSMALRPTCFCPRNANPITVSLCSSSRGCPRVRTEVPAWPRPVWSRPARLPGLPPDRRHSLAATTPAFSESRDFSYLRGLHTCCTLSLEHPTLLFPNLFPPLSRSQPSILFFLGGFIPPKTPKHHDASVLAPHPLQLHIRRGDGFTNVAPTPTDSTGRACLRGLSCST